MFVQVEDLKVIQALLFVPWLNEEAQLAFYINEEFWLPWAKIFVKSTEEGFQVMLKEDDITWKTEALFTVLDD